MALGYGLYALVYLGFALAQSPAQGVALLLLYGLYSAALKAPAGPTWPPLVPAGEKASAIGLYHTLMGLLLPPGKPPSASSGRPSGPHGPSG